MRNILHVIDTPGPGGAEAVYLSLVKGIDRSRFHCIVTTSGPDADASVGAKVRSHGWLYDEMERAGLSPRLVATHGAFDVHYLARIARIARSERADVIHAHLLTASVYCSAVGMLTGIPVVSTFHGTGDIGPASRFTRLKLAVINRGSARIAFVSDHLRRSLLATTNLDGAKAVVVHNGIDCRRFAPSPHGRLRVELGLGAKRLVVGSVGNIRPAKDYETLLDAAALLARRGAAIDFVIAGDDKLGLRAGLEARRSRLGIDHMVRFIGFRSDAAEFLNGLDALVLSSRHEGFSLATVEAMACGLPVVATRCGGPEEIVADGKTGLLVDVQSPDQLADALMRVTDPQVRQQLGARARATAVDHFDVSAMVRRFEALYAQL